MKGAERAGVVSSYTGKGALIDETWTACERWDFAVDATENVRRLRQENPFGKTASWTADIAKMITRRINPIRDRSLILLAQANCDRETWKPLLLWHITRDERLFFLPAPALQLALALDGGRHRTSAF